MNRVSVNFRTIEEQSGMLRDIVSADTDEIPRTLRIIKQEDVDGSYPIQLITRTESSSGKVELKIYEDGTIDYRATIPFNRNPSELIEELRMVRMTCEALSKELVNDPEGYKDVRMVAEHEEYFLIYTFTYSDGDFTK